MVQVTSTLTLHHREHVSKTLVLEPWAEEFRMTPGDRFELVACGPPVESPFEVELCGALVIVHVTWAQSRVTVARNGAVLPSASAEVRQL